jgi:hypothetical protein
MSDDDREKERREGEVTAVRDNISYWGEGT